MFMFNFVNGICFMFLVWSFFLRFLVFLKIDDIFFLVVFKGVIVMMLISLILLYWEIKFSVLFICLIVKLCLLFFCDILICRKYLIGFWVCFWILVVNLIEFKVWK